MSLSPIERSYAARMCLHEKSLIDHARAIGADALLYACGPAIARGEVIAKMMTSEHDATG
jgi:hypothetical protein